MKKISRLLFILGLLLLFYPMVSSMIQKREQASLIQTYVENSKYGKNELAEWFKKAQEYNQTWCQMKDAIVGERDVTLEYKEQLQMNKDGIMGAITIPKISVSLPIYHGTEEEILKNGVGHFEESALPVGGENTRCILTAHRGLPNSKLFTRLDEMEKGDLFYLKVCNETLAYKVREIMVIKPEELNRLQIYPEKDLVSLITCTPYGINTHRLVVTGERVPYEEKEYENIKPKWFSARELIFAVLPFVLLGMEIISYIKGKKEKRWKRKHEKD